MQLSGLRIGGWLCDGGERRSCRERADASLARSNGGRQPFEILVVP
jgi:hypothetical protein